jgi:hypothetical protein
MNGAMAEALAKAESEEDVEKKVEAALACPCLGKRPCAAPDPGRRGWLTSSAASWPADGRMPEAARGSQGSHCMPCRFVHCGLQGT